jgi:peptide/nickel transport system substrate-binding protein
MLSACKNASSNTETRQVFNYNEMNGLSSLDPAAASNFENISVVNQLFNGLVQAEDNLSIVPCIAQRYELSEDGMTYVFYLRSDVYFHNNPCFKDSIGRKVIANDFKYSFDRLYDSKVSSAGNLMDLFDSTAAFEAKNDSTFIVRLKTPFSALLNVIAMKYFSVLPKEAVEYYKQDFRNHPVGTGPFTFKIWQEGTKLILLKNKHYFEKDSAGNALPYLDAMTVSFMRDKETAFMELLNGKFDMLSGADAFNANEVLDKEGRLRDIYKKHFVLQKSTFLKTDYIGILVDEQLPLVQQSPLKQKLVRQAISYAFDRKKMIKYLRHNLGVAAEAGFIPPGLKSYDTAMVKGYSYNPTKAAELLKEAGFEGGRALPELTLYTTENYKEQAEFIQSELARNNIRTQISVEKPSVLRQAVNRGEYLLFRKSWVADYADEENFMSLFYSKNFAPKGINFFHYSNQQFDRLYEKAAQSTEASEKIKLYQEMDKLLIEDAPVITLFYDQVVRLVNPSIQNLSTNPMNILNLKKVKKIQIN